MSDTGARARRGATAERAGAAAEDAALRLYESRGAELLERRWRGPSGEIDLILREAGCLVFAEVKARRSFADAAHSVTSRQWARLVETAEAYMLLNQTGQIPARFDVVLVNRDGAAEIIENAREQSEW